MLNARELTHSNELKREGYLFLFLSLIIQQQHSSHSTHQQLDYPYQIYVNYAIEFIENNYHKNIKIQDLAHYIGISRTYLTSSFKKILNMSPQNYLLNYRLDQASILLKNTMLTISEISHKVGYDDPLAFSKLFKQHKGISPKLYRLNNEATKVN